MKRFKNFVEDKEYDLFENIQFDKNIISSYKRIMPSGATLYTDNVKNPGDSPILKWEKKGGYAGENTIEKVVKKAMSAGFKKSDSIHDSNPDGSISTKETILKDVDGAVLSHSSSYSSNPASNHYTITLTLPPKSVTDIGNDKVAVTKSKPSKVPDELIKLKELVTKKYSSASGFKIKNNEAIFHVDKKQVPDWYKALKNDFEKMSTKAFKRGLNKWGWGDKIYEDEMNRKTYYEFAIELPRKFKDVDLD